MGFFFFFFQAEDGIRDLYVTGVQTCALPIFKLVQQPGAGWPWWAAMLAALACCGAVGALQGTLTARLKIPSFIVTLAGFLLFSGILVVVLGGADGTVSISSSSPNQRVIYDLVQG